MMVYFSRSVIPAQAGTSIRQIPACAGMTSMGDGMTLFVVGSTAS